MSIRELFNQLIRPTGAGGPSSTKLVYLSNGVLCALSAFLGTLAAVGRFVKFGTTDATFCGFMATLWGISIGFAAGAKRHAATMTKEIKVEESK